MPSSVSFPKISNDIIIRALQKTSSLKKKILNAFKSKLSKSPPPAAGEFHPADGIDFTFEHPLTMDCSKVNFTFQQPVILFGQFVLPTGRYDFTFEHPMTMDFGVEVNEMGRGGAGGGFCGIMNKF